MKVIRSGLMLLTAFSVFAFACVEPWAQSVVEMGASALLVLWAALYASGKIHGAYWNPASWALLGFLVIILAQYLLHSTIYLFATKIELLKFIAFFILFYFAGQVFRASVQRVFWAWFVLLLGFSVSLFGIVQHFTFNGKLYWVRQFSYHALPFGPFTNRDHFAGFAELVIPIGLSMLLLGGARRDQAPLVALFTIVPIGAVFLSASRGGIITICVQICLVVYSSRKVVMGVKRSIALAAVVLVATAFIAWLGIGASMERFASLKSDATTSEYRRWIMIRDSWKIAEAHPVLGSGLGTLETAYPKYASYYDGLVVNHSHNDYIEALAETGFAGALCCAWFLVAVLRGSLKEIGSSHDAAERAARIGALIACAGLLIHGMVDFNLHVFSNALIFFMHAQLASSAPAPLLKIAA